MKIERAYLQWISDRPFPTSKAFIDEAIDRGVSRRVPNLITAAALAQPGTVIFLIHAEGRKEECLACAETVMCTRCDSRNPNCPLCRGLGSIERGTGGYAVVDGERWSYLRYIKMRRRAKHSFWQDEHLIKDVTRCKNCGGHGSIPRGAVFGFFVPDAVEYIPIPRDKKITQAMLEARNIKTVSGVAKEARRAEGFRQPGFYMVTRPKDDGDEILREVIIQLIDAGILSPPDLGSIHRHFATLLEPMLHSGKRFRGLKRIDLKSEKGTRRALEGVA